MNLRTKRSVSKIRQMSGPFVKPDCWWHKISGETNKPGKASMSTGHGLRVKIIFQLRAAPGRKYASSQDCVSLSCKYLETRMLNNPFFDPAVCEKTAMRLNINL